MSTKDLIERLNRSGPQPRRAAAGESGPDDREVRTRVGARVIRRRRVKTPTKPPAPPTIEAETTEQVEAAPATPEEAPATEAEAKAPVEVESAPEAEEVAAEPAEEAEAEAEAEVEVAAEATDPTAEEAPSEEVSTAPDEEPAEAEAGAEVEAAETAPEDADAKPDAEQAAEEDPAASVEAAPIPPRVEEAPDHLNLPRLGAKPAGGQAAFPGLGSAVVRPPPGYDPNDPSGNARRAQEANKVVEPDDAKKRVWRDEMRPGSGNEKAQQRRGRPARERRRRTGRVEMYMDDIPQAHRRRRRGGKSGPKQASPLAKAIKRRVDVNGTITVADLAHSMKVKSGAIIKHLMDMGQMVTTNDQLDLETSQLVATEFGHEVIDTQFKEETHLIDISDEDESSGVSRPPVVTIMGHVDHGKTTLLDTIRNTNVAGGEAGGITQHVAAYQVTHNDQILTFIDTPGHEAFTSMRARGAQVTDIVVLVIAADDGVMPQTVEAISHSRAAGVQIIVAVNKCDKAGSNPDKVRQALMEHELVPEEYGGDTIFVNISALKGEGLDDLLDNLLLLAEVAEYKANPDRHAEGAVLEARIERGRGAVATVLVKEGTLNIGDSIVLGEVWGRVRAMSDFAGKDIKTAGPCTPVEVIGLQHVPLAGDHFAVVESDRDARTLAGHRASKSRTADLNPSARATLEDLLAQTESGETIQLNLIIKADVGGSLEALRQTIDKIDIEGTEVKLLHSAVGGVSESDITLAHTYNAVIIAFNVRPDAKARKASDRLGVEIRNYSVIYEALDEVKKALRGLLGPTIREAVQGMAEIRETFVIPKIGTVAGCMVTDGKIGRNHEIRLLRDGVIVWTGKLASLRRFKDDVKKVDKGYECGMNLEGYNDIKVGDMLEAFTQEEVVDD